MKDEVSHKGIVRSIDRFITQVEIVRESACASCHAKSLCGYSESEVKLVSVPTDAFAMLQEGDEVELCLKRSMGMKAVWIAYVVPLVIMVAVILLASAIGSPELYMGLAAIAAVALYYLIILCFRKKLNNQFVFYIKKKYE